MQTSMEDETQRLVKEGARGFVAARHSLARVRQMRAVESGYEREVWRALAEAGWLGLRVPEALGGGAMSVRETVALCEVFGEVLLPEPFVACALVPSMLVAGSANATLRATLLPGIVGGSRVLTLAWQEKPFELEPGSCEATLVATSSGQKLCGTKRFVAAAVGADGYLVTCKRDGSLVLVHVPSSAAGITLTPHRLIDGSVAATLVFEDVALTAADVLAEGAGASALLGRTLDEATLAVSAMLLAQAAQALKTSIDYLKQRVQFGRAIGTFQALQHRAVDLAIQCTLAGAALRHAVNGYEVQPAAACPDISAAKALCSRAADTVARAAIQMHGGIGYTDAADIGLYLKSAVRLSAYLGAPQAHLRRFMAGQGAA